MTLMTETGRIVGIDDDALWLDMTQQSTCSRCISRKGCGERLIRSLGATYMLLRVPMQVGGATKYQLDDQVTVAIPDDIVVKSSLLVYLLPLLLLLFFSGFAYTFLGNELVTVLLGMSGLLVGVVLIRRYANSVRNDQRFHPVLLEQKNDNFTELR